MDNIGDIIMLGPALRTLHENLPQAHITLMASPAGSQGAPMLPWVDDVITWRALWQDISGAIHLDPARELRLVDLLRTRRFDAAVVFTSFSQSPYPPAYLCYLAGIPVRLGHSKEFGGGVLSHWVRPPADEGHQVDRNLSLLEAAGFLIQNRRIELTIPLDVQARAEALLQEIGIDSDQAFIALVPGASAEARRYEPDRFAEVAALLYENSGLPVVIFGSQRETQTLKPVMNQANGLSIFSLVGKTTVTELAAAIKRSSIVIACNSASLHIADAFEVPMVILYSGTETLSQWEPRYSAARLLRRETACSPCYIFRCPYHMECLDIPAEEVVDAAVELLAIEEIQNEKVSS